MTKPDWQSDLPDGDAGVPAEAPGGSAAELRDQAEIDGLLRLQSGDLAVPAGLARRVQLALWHRRLRVVLEWTAAAVIVIGLAVSYGMFMSRPAYRLDGVASVTDGTDRSAQLGPGVWIKTTDKSATLIVGDHTRIDISPGTRLQLIGSAGECGVLLDVGQVLYKAGGERDKARIDTPMGNVTTDAGPATVGVRIDKKDGPADLKLTVTVVAGEAKVTEKNSVVRLRPGDVRTWPAPIGREPEQGRWSPRPGASPTPPVPVPPGGPGGTPPSTTSGRGRE